MARTKQRLGGEEREGEILEVARGVLLERGFPGLTMDRIAEGVSVSKGTVYQHFSCKEDVVLALAIQTRKVRAKLFEQASLIRGRTRERMMGFGVAIEVFVERFPDHNRAEMLFRNDSVRERGSAERQREFLHWEQRCMDLAAGVVRDAIASGDLALTPGLTPETLTFGLWSMTCGAYSLMDADLPMTELGIADPTRILRANQHRLLDGYGWRPLSSEFDYGAAELRIRSLFDADPTD